MAKGFTLVEILIVVVILGILAAIVIPQFTNASETAKASSLVSQLQTIRSQIELYQVQHNGTYPTLASLQTGDPDQWTQLTTKTDVDGAAGSDFGPYLQKAPTNPFTNGPDVAATATADWVYDASTGAIQAVIPSTKWEDIDELGLGSAADITAGYNSDVIEAAAAGGGGGS
jgi:general secretion pathway protein G